MSSLANTDIDGRADVAPAPSPATPMYSGPAQYFAVPWELITSTTGEPISLTCRYFDAAGQQVNAQSMESPNAFFRLTQGGPDTKPKLPQPKVPVAVSLFSAVARTLTASCSLNNNFTASGPDGATSVIVPVLPGSTRGVILVFRYPASGTVEGLVATSDPEIKNSSNTSDPLV